MVRSEQQVKKEEFSKKYSDLDSLFGRWSEEEFREITSKIDQERSIDPELWT